jgi:hypothetical protein
MKKNVIPYVYILIYNFLFCGVLFLNIPKTILIRKLELRSLSSYSNPKSVSITSRLLAWESMFRGSASPATIEVEPPDLRYQALPGNE